MGLINGDPKILMLEPEQVANFGFANFNRNPHLCVEVPDGNFTISCRTSTGELITFAFVPYRTGEAAQCVDVQRHTTAFSTSNGRPIQNVICFTPGGDTFRSDSKDKRPTTLMTVLLHEPKTVEQAMEGTKEQQRLARVDKMFPPTFTQKKLPE